MSDSFDRILDDPLKGGTQSDSSSSDKPPPGDDSSSPPSDSNSPPSDSGGGSSDSPPSDSGGGSSDSPPSDSGSSPPKDSGSSDSGSSKSPPSDSGSDSSQNSSPPDGGGDSQPSPDSSSNDSPPKDQSSPSNDSPKSDNSSPSSSNSPKDSNGPPTWQESPPQPRTRGDETPGIPSPPGSKASQRHPELTPSRSESGSSSHSSRSSDSDSSATGTIAGVTVAGVIIIALVALVFAISRKKKRRVQAYPDHYGPPPNFSGNSDAFYYGHHSQQHTIGISGQSQEFYGAKPPPPPPQYSNNYGSYRGGPDSGVIGGGMSSFSYEELMGITNGFSRQNVIGEGGFGSVYKGFLSDGRAVAVKQLKAGSGQGEREFRAEVDIISRVHHRHLVSLVGYCIAEGQRLLVYEFVSNKTLEYHLHGEGLPVMEWSKRMSIAVGAARGLAYLHEDCHPKIIHRDIKSANILVDDVFEAQVADFGLAKLSNDMSTHVSTRVMGTFGYMAPEYANSGKLTDRSDVFSFGVVLLELVTGRKPVDLEEDESLVEWARPICARAVETGDFSEIADPRLQKRYVESEMLRMIETAAACVRHSAQKRPRMVQVLRALDTDGDMPDISNGVKVGQSTIYQVGQYNSEMEKFRMMAFGGGDSSEYQMYSGDSKEVLPRPPKSVDSETVAINPRAKTKDSLSSYSNRQY